MNFPVWAECFIPSVNTKMSAGFIGGNMFLPETHESIAVFESRNMVVGIVSSPKPTYPVFYTCAITRDPMVLLVLVEVCEFVEFAFYHIKKLPRIHAFALCDLRDLEQGLLSEVVKTALVVALILRRVRHRGDSERKVKRAVLVIDEPLQCVGTTRLFFRQILVDLFKEFGRRVASLAVVLPVVATEKCLLHPPTGTVVILEILTVDFRVFLLLQLDRSL